MRENIILYTVFIFLGVSGTIVIPKMLRAIVRIIQKRRHVQVAADSGKEKWERVLECMTQESDMLVLVYDPQKNCVEYVSESVRWLFGISKERVVRDATVLFDSLGLSKKEAVIRDFCRTELVLPQEKDFLVMNVKGSVRSLHMRTAPSGDGKNILMIADRTEDYEKSLTVKTATEAYLREREEKQIIMACLKKIAVDPYQEQPAPWGVLPDQEVTTAFQQVSDMIHNVVEAVEPDDGQEDGGVISMENLVREVEDRVLPQFSEREQTLKINLSVTDEKIEADKKRVQQVMRSLLENASAYSLRNGNITLSVSQRAGAGESGNEYVIVVEDDGIGIPPEFMPRLFMPFERADDPRVRRIEGDGLGLVIVKNIVDDMGGRIEVENREEGGTRFRVYLDM